MPASSQSAATPETLVAGVSRRSGTRAQSAVQADSVSPLALWHLLSLDAPTVAALWVIFIARAAHVALPWTAPAAMFLAVWILYAADRLLDARASRQSLDVDINTLEARHHFHAAHAQAFLVGIALAAPALLALIHDIPPAAIRLYLFLGALLVAWFLLIHVPPATARLPKELAVGLFFPAAVFIPTVARAPWLRPVLIPEAILFAAVCSLNCLYIFAWEHPAFEQEAHWTTRRAVRHLRFLTLATVLGSLVLAGLILFPAHFPAELATKLHPALLPVIACAISAVFLLQLNSSRAHISPTHRRAAADLCLLVPALFLPVLR